MRSGYSAQDDSIWADEVAVKAETLIGMSVRKKQVSRLRGMALEARHPAPLEMTKLKLSGTS
jgi:hypothetical protein